MQVEIVTPLGAQYSGSAVMIEAPGLLGEMGLLPGHRDMLAALGTGVCRVFEAEHADPTCILVDEGYLQVSHGDRVIIVTELAERREDVDVERVREMLAEACAKLESTRESVGTRTWQVRKHAVVLAEARLKLTGAR